ncbi:ribonuclease H-like domain-containing protein [Tanacetum coccineum]
MGHFTRECRGPRNQDNRNRNQDSSKRSVNVEEISSTAMLAIDGAGFNWSYMADDEVPTKIVLGYDKSKVGCFNCYKMGHFIRECKGPKNQDNRNRNQDSSRRTVNVKEIASKSMLAIDGAGFNWSYMADDEVPTNMALMAFSDPENRV